MNRRFFLKLFSLLPFVPKVGAIPDYVEGMTFSFKPSAVNAGFLPLSTRPVAKELFATIPDGSLITAMTSGGNYLYCVTETGLWQADGTGKVEKLNA